MTTTWGNDDRMFQRYVKDAEKARGELLAASDDEVSVDSLKDEQATPAIRMSPFLAYGPLCADPGCECCDRRQAAGVRRDIAIAIAQLATYLARAGA